MILSTSSKYLEIYLLLELNQQFHYIIVYQDTLILIVLTYAMK